jgi:hypothetical protein
MRSVTKRRGFAYYKAGYNAWKELRDAGRGRISGIVLSSIEKILGKDLLSKQLRAQKVEKGQR